MNVNQALSSILRDGVDIHRCAAAQALGAIGNTASVDILIEALLDEDEDVRPAAARRPTKSASATTIWSVAIPSAS